MAHGFVAALAAAAAATLLAASQPARACTSVEVEFYAIEPDLRAVDSTAPTPFRDVVARVDRRPETVCRGEECTTSSCGSSGEIALRFQPPSDDQNDGQNLGYRVIWLRGQQPRSANGFLQHSWPLGPAGGSGEISLTIAYADVAELDAEISLVAIDRAGNESEPSEPIHLEFSGCTRDVTSNTCLDSGCSVQHLASPVSRGGGRSWLALGIALFGFRSLRRATRAR